MSAKKRCLMMGAGGMAGGWIRRFFPNFADRMEIVGLVDIKREPLDASGDFLGLPAERRFMDSQSAFDAVEADFCTIVTPPDVHKEAVMLAVDRGMDILSEKPIADTWEACVDIYRAVMGAGVKMQVVQNYRYESRILTLKKALDEGRVGRPNYIMGRFAADYRKRGAWGAFRHEIPHALLVEGAVHHFDQLRNLSGADCHLITGWEWNPDHPSFDGECCALFSMRMANDVKAVYEGSCLAAGWQNNWHREYYRVECENGVLTVDKDDIVRVLEHTGGGAVKMEELQPVEPEWAGHNQIIKDFLDWLDGGPEPATALSDNIKSAAMLFGAVDASETGRCVDVAAKATIES